MSTVAIVEVAPRDGLQNAAVTLPPARRSELVRRLDAARVPRIEATSFVHPRAVPQMADAEAVVAELGNVDAKVCALVLNERGYERLAAARVRGVRYAFAVSEAFNRRNSNASVEDSLRGAAVVLRRAHDAGLHAGVVLATSFGCPFSGAVDPGLVIELASTLGALHPAEIVFADTIGVATPREVRTVVEGAAALGVPVGVHLHNTRNTGYANAFAALDAGADILDASVGGLGGCPFAPDATGNVATEDLVYMLEREGVDTAIDLDELCATARWLRDVCGLELDGQLHRVGAPVAHRQPEGSVRCA
jgi:hydroxymethylglutaryl-CoA lyase/(R)-citramalyl-CoA lyase